MSYEQFYDSNYFDFIKSWIFGKLFNFILLLLQKHVHAKYGDRDSC